MNERTVLAILIGVCIVATAIFMLIRLNTLPEQAVAPSRVCAGYKTVNGVVKGTVTWPAHPDGTCHNEDAPEPVVP